MFLLFWLWNIVFRNVFIFRNINNSGYMWKFSYEEVYYSNFFNSKKFYWNYFKVFNIEDWLNESIVIYNYNRLLFCY